MSKRTREDHKEKALNEEIEGRRSARLTIDLSPDFQKRLDRLAEKTYLGSKATVVRHALVLYEYLVAVVNDGGEIVIRSPAGKEQSVSPVALAVGG